MKLRSGANTGEGADGSHDAEDTIDGTYKRIRATLAMRRLPMRVPRLRNGDEFTTMGLMLVFFYRNLGEVRTIGELKAFLDGHGCASINPQPRHLGMQYGFRFLVQNCAHPRTGVLLRRGQYCLASLVSAHPAAHRRHRDGSRALTDDEFASLRRRFGGRCSVCGSVEGEPHLKNPLLTTTLERGHADPLKPLTLDNCLPMCHLCNRAYKDHATFNHRGIIVRWSCVEK